MLIVCTIAPTVRGFLLPYAEHYRRLGWDVEAAANGATTDPVLLATFDRVHELPLSRSILDVGGIARSLAAMSKVLEAGFDLVHVHTPIAAFVTRAAARRMPRATRPAVVYTAHGFHFHGQGGALTNTIFLTAEKVSGRWTDRLIVINQEDHDAALRHRIVPARRLVLMPGIGVDTDKYSRARLSPDAIADARSGIGISPGTPLFVDVAEFTRRKRPLEMIRAMSRMRHAEAHLVMLGEGPVRPEAEELVTSLGLNDRVHMLGFVPDVRPVVAAAVALVLPSDREGLPRSIMEALSMEVPVIASDARGNPELVLPDAGLIFPVGDVDALAAAMDSLIDRPDEARMMGQSGRARMVDQYDLPILIEQHAHLYEEVLAERSRLTDVR